MPLDNFKLKTHFKKSLTWMCQDTSYKLHLTEIFIKTTHHLLGDLQPYKTKGLKKSLNSHNQVSFMSFGGGS